MVIAVRSHDMWLIEEKAKIFRSFIKFSPPKAPIIAERIAEVKINLRFIVVSVK